MYGEIVHTEVRRDGEMLMLIGRPFKAQKQR